MSKELYLLTPGQVFGRLTIICKDEEKTRLTGRQYYWCQWSCGSPKKVYGRHRWWTRKNQLYPVDVL